MGLTSGGTTALLPVGILPLPRAPVGVGLSPTVWGLLGRLAYYSAAPNNVVVSHFFVSASGGCGTRRIVHGVMVWRFSSIVFVAGGSDWGHLGTSRISA